MLKPMASVTALACKSIISYDGGFLKADEWVGYQILVSSSQDGENNDVLNSICLAASESSESYTFMMSNQKKDPKMKGFLQDPNLVVPTDRAKGLASAIQSELTDCIPRICNLHLLGNIPGPSLSADKGIGSAYLTYWKAAKATSVAKFEEAMNRLIEIAPEAFEYLSKLDPSLWSDHAFPGRTWGQSTNNMSERAVNFIGSHGRSLPPRRLITDVLAKVSYVTIAL